MTSTSSRLTSSKDVEAWIRTLVLLCIFDLICTISEIQTGVAEEYNPILKYFLDNGGLLEFSLFKISLTAICCFVLAAHRERKIAQVGILIALVSYTIVFFYHIVGMLLWI